VWPSSPSERLRNQVKRPRDPRAAIRYNRVLVVLDRFTGAEMGDRAIFCLRKGPLTLPRAVSHGLVALTLAAVLAACEKKPPLPAPPLSFTQVDFSALPGWSEDEQAMAIPALVRSCIHLEGRPDGQALGAAGWVGGTVADWRAPCAAIKATAGSGSSAARGLVETWFVPFQMKTPKDDTGLVTGYYEAELKGALFPGGGFTAPIYARPDDLVTVDLGAFTQKLKGQSLVGKVADGRLKPYPARRDIDAGMLDGRGVELLWAEDPVDVFFLHIQGSGKVRFPDGSERRIGYAMSNGRGFTGIGRLLLDAGKIPRSQASMQGIRDWLRAHPREGREFMERNARYIFFRWIDGDGPIGAQGVALTAGRSIAVDPRFVPYGMPVFLDTTWPGKTRPLRRLMVAQDTGAAIKGPLRADFFWGTGEKALDFAGGMKQRGRFYILVPKSVAERRKATS